MGIPAFYRWIAERYARSIVDVVRDVSPPTYGAAAAFPLDTSKPNPNGLEFDNLYLDMNGIIHPCFHPEGMDAPESYDDVFKAIFKYIDALFSIVRPRKLLFMAIDGVAPRAKMNQQRSRRFRAAKDAADEVSKTESSRKDALSEGLESKANKLDSNIITPGTEFMELLSSALRYYVHLKMNSDPGWRGIKVILSDASVPGEGEHKAMSYIRLQRNLPGYDPNTRHCLYGLDADLIMLALATHEIHFSILREDVRRVLPNDKGQDHSSNNKGYVKHIENFISGLRFQFLHIWVLRDYIALELRPKVKKGPKVKKSAVDRLVDEFVFMCIFVGNDFLPHVPSLEISEGAIDLLMTVYKKEFSNMGGYLTNSCEVDLDHVEHFVQAVGAYESAIFRKRVQAQKEWESRNSSKFNAKRVQNSKREISARTRSATHKLNAKGVKESPSQVSAEMIPAVDKSNAKGVKKSPSQVSAEMIPAVDKIKLGEEGYKERYYSEKFRVHDEEELQRVQKHTVWKYVEGICWVMRYYYEGVCSWQWFYPYHYAPFASDFRELKQFKISFSLGRPFKPFDQLMAVLPSASSQALPLSYRKLMTDPSSPILDFYPADFELDMNGKRHSWQAVCKLPFIDESRLLPEIRKAEHTLTDEEKRRNSLSLDVLFVHSSHPMAAKIFSFCKRNKNNPKLPQAKVKRKIDPAFSGGMNGYMYISSKPVRPVEILSPIDDMELITRNRVVSVFYKLPAYHPHISKVPKGVVLNKECITKDDIQPPPILWHEKTTIGHRRQRHLPKKCLSGAHLAKLAHELVWQKYSSKAQNNADRDTGEVGKRRRDEPDLHPNKRRRVEQRQAPMTEF